MKLYSVIKKGLLVLLVIIFFALAIALAVTPGLKAFASSELKSAYEQADLQTELESMGFNLEDYPRKDEGDVELFSFMEYGFSEFFNVTDDYGLYFYLYNPRELVFDFDSVKNYVQIGSDYDDNGACIDYDKYQLEFVSSAFNGRYLKLKVDDLLVVDIHGILDVKERRYDIAGIELIEKGETDAEEYSVATTFYYTGFAKGYAEDVEAESTLQCRTVELETIELNVKHTTYKAWNTDNVSGQEMATVYFNVPDRYFNEYGNLQQIKAEWLYSVTDYIYCTWYQDLYDKLLPYVGKTVEYEKDLPYCFYSSMEIGLNGYDSYVHDAYNVKSGSFTHVMSRISTINWIMPNFNNSSEELLKYVMNSENKDKLLSHVDSEKTIKVIDAGDTYDLKGLDKNHSGWEWLWEYLGFTDTFQTISPIYVVTDSDVNLSNVDFAKVLYVNENDVDDIKAEHLESGSRTVLFRFAINSFESQDLEVGASGLGNLPNDFDPGKGYLFRTKLPLYQSFDIIHLGFQKAGKLTIIPAVSNPITIIGSTEPPINNNDKDWSGGALMESVFGEDWEDGCEEAKRTLLIVLMALIGLVLLYFIVRFIIWLKPQRVKVKVKKPKVKKSKSVKPPKV